MPALAATLCTAASTLRRRKNRSTFVVAGGVKSIIAGRGVSAADEPANGKTRSWTGKRKLDELVLTGMSHVLPYQACRPRQAGHSKSFSSHASPPPPWRSAMSLPAAAHDAKPTAAKPQGWTYPFSCCSGYDCREVSSKQISEKPEGYVIKGTGEVVAYSDARLKDSPDGEFTGARWPARTIRARSACSFRRVPIERCAHPDTRLSGPSRYAAMGWAASAEEGP